MNTPLKRVIGRQKPTSTRIVTAYLPQDRPDPAIDRYASVLAFEREHDERSTPMYFGGKEGVSLGSERTRHYNDAVFLQSYWREEFRRMQVKTYRLMDEATAQKVQAAQEAMERAILRARADYASVLQQAWDASRPLRQRDVDPELQEED